MYSVLRSIKRKQKNCHLGNAVLGRQDRLPSPQFKLGVAGGGCRVVIHRMVLFETSRKNRPRACARDVARPKTVDKYVHPSSKRYEYVCEQWPCQQPIRFMRDTEYPLLSSPKGSPLV